MAANTMKSNLNTQSKSIRHQNILLVNNSVLNEKNSIIIILNRNQSCGETNINLIEFR